MTLQYYVLRLRPAGRLPQAEPDQKEARLEFDVLRAISLRERPAIVPYETKWIKRPNKKFVIERKYPLFPCYIFAGFESFADLLKIREDINIFAEQTGRPPPILGAVGYGAKPSILSEEVVAYWRKAMNYAATEINLHRAVKVGGKAEITSGAFAHHVGTVVSVAKKRAKIELNIFDSLRVIEVDAGSLVAA